MNLRHVAAMISQFIKLLAPLSYLYRLAMVFRRRLYARGFLSVNKLPGCTISVGNLEVGGTGKTPVCIALAQYLLEAGFKPAILTRGYRSGLRSEDSAVLINKQLMLPPQHPCQFFADEARLQSHHLPSVPVIIGANRFAAAQRYLQKQPTPTHWILEDGLQHLKIKRDLDIVLLDYDKPFDNGFCIPAGRLREAPNTLKVAQAIIFTRSPKQPQLPKVAKLHIHKQQFIDYAQFSTGTPYPVHSEEAPPFEPSKSTGLIAGIAKPQQLITDLKRQNIAITRTYRIADHAPISSSIVEDLSRTCEQVITTEKDYFRHPEVFTKSLNKLYLVPLNISSQRGFHKFFKQILDGT